MQVKYINPDYREMCHFAVGAAVALILLVALGSEGHSGALRTAISIIAVLVLGLAVEVIYRVQQKSTPSLGITRNNPGSDILIYVYNSTLVVAVIGVVVFLQLSRSQVDAGFYWTGAFLAAAYVVGELGKRFWRFHHFRLFWLILGSYVIAHCALVWWLHSLDKPFILMPLLIIPGWVITLALFQLALPGVPDIEARGPDIKREKRQIAGGFQGMRQSKSATIVKGINLSMIAFLALWMLGFIRSRFAPTVLLALLAAFLFATAASPGEDVPLRPHQRTLRFVGGILVSGLAVLLLTRSR